MLALLREHDVEAAKCSLVAHAEASPGTQVVEFGSRVHPISQVSSYHCASAEN